MFAAFISVTPAVRQKRLLNMDMANSNDVMKMAIEIVLASLVTDCLQ